MLFDFCAKGTVFERSVRCLVSLPSSSCMTSSSCMLPYCNPIIFDKAKDIPYLLLHFSWDNKEPVATPRIKQMLNMDLTETANETQLQRIREKLLKQFKDTCAGRFASLFERDTDMAENTETSTASVFDDPSVEQIITTLDPVAVADDCYPSPTQDDIYSVLRARRFKEPIVFAYRSRWYSLLDVYEKSLRLGMDDAGPSQYVWKDRHGEEVSSEIMSMIETALNRCKGRNPDALLSGVGVCYVSMGGEGNAPLGPHTVVHSLYSAGVSVTTSM